MGSTSFGFWKTQGTLSQINLVPTSCTQLPATKTKHQYEWEVRAPALVRFLQNRIVDPL